MSPAEAKLEYTRLKAEYERAKKERLAILKRIEDGEDLPRPPDTDLDILGRVVQAAIIADGGRPVEKPN